MWSSDFSTGRWGRSATNLGREASKGKLTEAEIEPTLGAHYDKHGPQSTGRRGLCG